MALGVIGLSRCRWQSWYCFFGVWVYGCRGRSGCLTWCQKDLTRSVTKLKMGLGQRKTQRRCRDGCSSGWSLHHHMLEDFVRRRWLERGMRVNDLLRSHIICFALIFFCNEAFHPQIFWTFPGISFPSRSYPSFLIRLSHATVPLSDNISCGFETIIYY